MARHRPLLHPTNSFLPETSPEEVHCQEVHHCQAAAGGDGQGGEAEVVGADQAGGGVPPEDDAGDAEAAGGGREGHGGMLGTLRKEILDFIGWRVKQYLHHC